MQLWELTAGLLPKRLSGTQGSFCQVFDQNGDTAGVGVVTCGGSLNACLAELGKVGFPSLPVLPHLC